LQISHLALHNFRCYRQIDLDLPPGVSIFVGPNASGKTSLLEAVLVLATSKSPRTTRDRELVYWTASWGSISGQFRGMDTSSPSIRIVLRGAVSGDEQDLPSVLNGAKHIEVNGVRCDSVTELVGQAPAVLFSPDDLQLVKAGPAVRRRFLNTALAQLMPRYLDDLLRYRRALRQRNELLKQMQAGRAMGSDLAPWTSQLVETGSRISGDRQNFIAALGEDAGQLHTTLSDHSEQLTLQYDSVLAGIDDPDEKAEVFREELERSHEQELHRGITVIGPHRDEMAVAIDGYAARQFASQGQQRTAALSLKLAEAQVMQKRRGEPPILLLDDCLSELDTARAAKMVELAGQFEQILITSAGSSSVLRESNYGAWYEITDGRIRPQ